MPVSVFHSALCAFSCFAEQSFSPLAPFLPLPLDARIDARQTMFAGHFQSRDSVTHRGSTLAETHLSALKLKGKVRTYPASKGQAQKRCHGRILWMFLFSPFPIRTLCFFMLQYSAIYFLIYCQASQTINKTSVRPFFIGNNYEMT